MNERQPTLARIAVTPIKGTALQHPSHVALDAAGIAGNRRFHLIDERGALVSGDAHGVLVRVHAAYEAADERLTCRFPDGTEVEGPADATGERVVTDFYGRPAPGAVLGGGFADAFSSLVGRALRLVRLDREGDGPDVRPLTVISTASARDLGRRGGHAGELDARRFRMNLELDNCEPYEEDTWRGREAAIGEAILRLEGPVARCVFTTLSPETGDKDFDTLKEIVRYRPLIDAADGGGIPFGVYASTASPGVIRLGDALRLLP